MLNYKLPYHVIQETEDEVYIPKLSFSSKEDALEFIKFAPLPNLVVIKTEDLRKYYITSGNTKIQF